MRHVGMGSRVICAPSNAQPPAVAPGLGALQPDFCLWLCSQAGSSSSARISFPFIVTSLTVGMRGRCNSRSSGALIFKEKGLLALRQSRQLA
jgi:hypothetical protein